MSLKRTKTWWIATGLLSAASLAFILSLIMTRCSDGWWWNALKAFSEAAMVGALADWFAVVALFDHPLGLPIPHTAILRKNQKRVAESISRFFCESFLNEEEIKAKVEALHPSQKLLTALKSSGEGVLSQSRATLMKLLLPMLQDDELRYGLAEHTGNFLRQLPLEKAATSLLQGAASSSMPEEAVDFVLSEAQTYIQAHHQELANAVDKKIAAALTANLLPSIPVLSTLGLGNLVVMMIGDYVSEVRNDKTHSLRREVVGIIRNNLSQCHASDSAIMTTLQGAKENFLQTENLFWLLDDARKQLLQYSERSADLEEGLFGHIVNFMEEYPDCAKMIDSVLAELAYQNIPRLRENISAYLYTTIMAWDIDEMVQKINEQVGDDLQYIRMNGTVIGGTIGLMIYAATCLF